MQSKKGACPQTSASASGAGNRTRSPRPRAQASPADAIAWQVQVLSEAICTAKKAPVLRQVPLLLVRVTGLEPARQGHQNLNLARLPFRHTRMNGYASSIPVQSRFVNRPRGRAQPDVPAGFDPDVRPEVRNADKI